MLAISDMLASLGTDAAQGVVSGVAATLAAIGTYVLVARYLRDYRRPNPVFEVSDMSDSEWPGWHQVAVTIRNTGPAKLVLRATSTGRFRMHKVAPVSALAVQNAYGNGVLPNVPPGRIDPIHLLNLSTSPNAQRPLTIRILVGPRKPGKTAPRRLSLMWHWADQPAKIRLENLRF